MSTLSSAATSSSVPADVLFAQKASAVVRAAGYDPRTLDLDLFVNIAHDVFVNAHKAIYKKILPDLNENSNAQAPLTDAEKAHNLQCVINDLHSHTHNPALLAISGADIQNRQHHAIGVCVGVLFAEGQRLWLAKQQQQQSRTPVEAKDDVESVDGGASRKSGKSSSSSKKKKKKLNKSKSSSNAGAATSTAAINPIVPSNALDGILNRINYLEKKLNKPTQFGTDTVVGAGAGAGAGTAGTAGVGGVAAGAGVKAIHQLRFKHGRIERTKSNNNENADNGNVVADKATPETNNDEQQQPQQQQQLHEKKLKRPASAPSSSAGAGNHHGRGGGGGGVFSRLFHQALHDQQQQLQQQKEKEKEQKEHSPQRQSPQQQEFVYDLNGRKIIITEEYRRKKEKEEYERYHTNTNDNIDNLHGNNTGDGNNGNSNNNNSSSKKKSQYQPFQPTIAVQPFKRSVEEWVNRARKELDEKKAYQQFVEHKMAGLSGAPPAVSSADIQSSGIRHFSGYSTLLQPNDVLVSVEHCHSCHTHGITLRHDSAEYSRCADNMLRVCVQTLHELQVAARVGVAKIKAHISSNTLGGNNNTMTTNTGTSSSSSSCEACRMGALEVQIAFRDAASGRVQVSCLHSKLLSTHWPSKSVVSKRLTTFVSCHNLPTVMDTDNGNGSRPFSELEIGSEYWTFPASLANGSDLNNEYAADWESAGVVFVMDRRNKTTSSGGGAGRGGVQQSHQNQPPSPFVTPTPAQMKAYSTATTKQPVAPQQPPAQQQRPQSASTVSRKEKESGKEKDKSKVEGKEVKEKVKEVKEKKETMESVATAAVNSSLEAPKLVAPAPPSAVVAESVVSAAAATVADMNCDVKSVSSPPRASSKSSKSSSPRHQQQQQQQSTGPAAEAKTDQLMNKSLPVALVPYAQEPDQPHILPKDDPSYNASCNTHAHTKTVLKDLHSKLQGEYWNTAWDWDMTTTLESWNSCCVCDTSHGATYTADEPECGVLRELHLRDAGLVGMLSTVQRLGDLRTLTVLDLSHNHIEGVIPASLGYLHSLQTLLFNNNAFTGTVPLELGRLEQLHTLDLSNNNLSGRLPRQLSACINIHTLKLHGNAQVEGPLPVAWMCLSVCLRTFTCDLYPYADVSMLNLWLMAQASMDWSQAHTHISVPADEVTALMRLYSCADHEAIESAISAAVAAAGGGGGGAGPGGLGSGASSAAQESTKSVFNDPFGYLANDADDDDDDIFELLTAMDKKVAASSPAPSSNANDTNKGAGAVPLAVKKQTPTKQPQESALALTARIDPHVRNPWSNWPSNANAATSGVASWAGVSVNVRGHVQSISLRNAAIQMQATADSNVLLPELSVCSELTYLDLAHNHLHGTLSPQLSLCISLRYLLLEHNQGICGDVWNLVMHCTELVHVNVSDNEITEAIPATLAQQLKKLKELHARNNKIGGQLPQSLLMHSSLETLDVSNNAISGEISLSGKATSSSSLHTLRLSDNPMLSGVIAGTPALKELRIENTGIKATLR